MYPAEPNKVVRMHVFCHQGQEIFRKEKKRLKKKKKLFKKNKTNKLCDEQRPWCSFFVVKFLYKKNIASFFFSVFSALCAYHKQLNSADLLNLI